MSLVRPHAVAEPLGYSVDEVAILLGISTWTVRRQIDAGQIPAVRYRSRVVVPRHALEQSLLAPVVAATSPVGLGALLPAGEVTAVTSTRNGQRPGSHPGPTVEHAAS